MSPCGSSARRHTSLQSGVGHGIGPDTATMVWAPSYAVVMPRANCITEVPRHRKAATFVIRVELVPSARGSLTIRAFPNDRASFGRVQSQDIRRVHI